MRIAGWLVTAVTFSIVLGCSGSPSAKNTGAPSAGSSSQATASKTMIMIARYEVTDLAPKILGSSNPILSKRLFNAALALMDGDESPRPYLAESLPELNTESWRPLPEGGMET